MPDRFSRCLGRQTISERSRSFDDAQHYCLVGRSEMESDDIAHLLDEHYGPPEQRRLR